MDLELKQDKTKRWIMADKDISLYAIHGLDFNEKRILIAGLSKVNGKSGFASYRKMITITAKEYSELYGIPLNHAYEDMKEASDKLYERSLKFMDDKTRSIHSKGEHRWLVGKHHNKVKGEISFCFNPYLERYFTQLKNNYTIYRIEEMRVIKSMYSQRMMEIVLTYQKTGKWIVSVSDLCTLMDAPKSCQDVYHNLKKVIIDRCVNDMRRKGWLIDYFASDKIGKKIIQLTFTFKRNEQLELM